MFISVKDGVLKKIQDELGDDAVYKFSSRLQVWADIEAFKWKEDESVWAQKREKIANYYTIYFDHEYVSGFYETDPIEKVMLEFWKGLKQLILDGKVDIDPVKSSAIKLAREMEIKKAEKEAKERINKLPESTPVEKMAKEVIKRASTTAT